MQPPLTPTQPTLKSFDYNWCNLIRIAVSDFQESFWPKEVIQVESQTWIEITTWS